MIIGQRCLKDIFALLYYIGIFMLTVGVIMKFNKDGKFKIMQITDIQEIYNVSNDTLKLLEAAVEKEKPDLVVYTGDQIKGYGVTYKGMGSELVNNVAKTIDKLIEPVTKRNIPFAVTFGNHDRQVGISNKDQFEQIYKKYPSCVGVQAEGIDGGGTCFLSIKSSKDDDKDVFGIYLFDTGTDAKGGGYEPFDTKIIEWYKKTRDSLKEKNGDYIPSLVFQHIPMFEHYNVLKQVKKSEKGAIPAFRIHKGEYYKIDETKCVPGSVLLEPPSIPDINTGEFEALKEKGDILGVYVGHDHKNSYVGKYDGIDIGFTQSSGFNVYGNGKERGVRCFVIDENDPKHYETYTKNILEMIFNNQDIEQLLPYLSKNIKAMGLNTEGVLTYDDIINHLKQYKSNQFTFFIDEFNTKAKIDQAMSQIEEVKNQILQNKTGDVYKDIKMVHDYLVDNIEYDSTISKQNIYNVYGALVNKECVCEGYARAFKYLMDELGISCVMVIGTGTNSNGQTENHAWNYVEVNNNWYAIDSTWDDPVIVGGGALTDESKYKYFLVGTDTINKDHISNGQFTDGGKEFTYPNISNEDYKE